MEKKIRKSKFEIRNLWFLLLVLTLAGCLPSSCRRVESRAISPADSLSRQMAAQMTPDTLAFVWQASGPDERALQHPRTVRFGPDVGLFVSDVERHSVYLFTAAGAFVERWLEVRSELGMNGTYPIFCTLAGARMGDAYIRVLLPRLGRKAGIEKRVHAHGLRHTHAAQLRVEGVDIGIISKQLGHRSIATTAHYLDHIAPQQVIEAMRTRVWHS